MNTTSPSRRGIIERVATVRVMLQTASTVRRWTARQPLSVISSAGAVNWPPALLTSTSTWPKRSIAASTTRSGSLGLADVGGDGEAGGAARLDLGPRALERLLAPPGERRRTRRSGRARARWPGRSGAAAGDERDAAGVGVRAQGTAEGRRAGGNPSHPIVDKPTSGRICLSTGGLAVPRAGGHRLERGPPRPTTALTRDRPESYGCRQSTGGDQWRRWRIPGVSRASSGRR